MASIGPKTDAGKGTGAKEVASGLYVDDSGDTVLSVGRRNTVYVDETAIRVQRKDGDILVFDGSVEIGRVNVGD